MFLLPLLLLTLTPQTSDPVQKALESFNATRSYQVTLRSRSDGSSEVIRYSFKKPGFVKMEFLKPRKGVVIVYNPVTGKARVRPFAFFKPLVITLTPGSPLIKSPRGHRIDESDIGFLLRKVHLLQKNGKTEITGYEKIGMRDTIKLVVRGSGNHTVNSIHSYFLWLDTASSLPLKVSAYDRDSDLIEEVIMDDLKTNVELSDDFFEL
jgi:outer membrane lipoprotein-sorting protein